DPAAAWVDGPARRRAVRLRARAASPRARPHRRCRRGRSRGLCRASGRGRGGAAVRRPRCRARARRQQAADRARPGALLRRGPQARGGLVGGGHRAAGVRPARHARGERGGAPASTGPVGDPPGVRPHRRLPRRRARGAGAGGLEGRPGRRLHRRRLRAGQGQAGRVDAGAAPGLPGLRLRDAQGLRHRRPHRGAGAARSLCHPSPALRQRAPGRGPRPTDRPAAGGGELM
ncbi:MAG: Ribonuclease HII, partial [uncultured Nocardioidaceae bacterium]